MDPPPQGTIMDSMYQLWVLGALDSTGDLTPIGKKMVEFPLDPPLSKMLILSGEYKCSEEILTIVSMLSVPSIFYRPKGKEKKSDKAQIFLSESESDHLTLLRVYNQWQENNYSMEWCRGHFIYAEALSEARKIRQQLLGIMEMQKVEYKSSGTDWDVVRKVICSAYFLNSARTKGEGEYLNMHKSPIRELHPSSAVYRLGHTPDYVVYHKLVNTTKSYMQIVTAIEPEWLIELGPEFFFDKPQYGNNKTKGQIEGEKMAMIPRKMTETTGKRTEQTTDKE